MMHAILLRGGLFALLWWVLAEGRVDGWVLGAVAVGAALWASIFLMPPESARIRLAGLFGFLGFFIWNSVRGGVQVAMLAFRGRDALQPAMLELPLDLPSDGARILMVNTLSLMPGTVCVEMRGDRLQLHVLDERLPVAADARALEIRIARLFGGVV